MRNRFQKVMKNQKGMTLVELLAVIVILAIVTAIAIPSIGGIINKSKQGAHVSNGLMVINAAKIGVANEDPDIVPIDDSTSKSVKLSDLVNDGYLDTVPQDPSVKGQTYNGEYSTVTITKTTTTTNGKSVVKYSYKVDLEPNSSKSTGSDKAYVNTSESNLNAGTAK